MKKFTKLTDETIMPWGEHEGKELKNIPSKYLLEIENKIMSDTGINDPFTNGLIVYIDKKRSELKKEVSKGHSPLTHVDVQGLLEKALSRMQKEFTSRQFGEACKILGVGNRPEEKRLKKYFLKFNCMQLSRYNWVKTYPNGFEERCIKYLESKGYTLIKPNRH